MYIWLVHFLNNHTKLNMDQEMQSFQFQMFDLAVTLNYVKVSGN